MSVFVASPVEIYHGAEADCRLAQTNDSRFATPRGILRVDAARWRQAQQYERDTWMVFNLETTTDRNEAHSAGFGGYAALPSDLGDYIELGCGPFTNTRFIIQGRTLSSLTLLDPLILDYERHPHCSYPGWFLQGIPVLAIPTTIEAWQPERAYHTVVMTNVLPHCYDAEMIFETVRRVLAPGGWLVFHEDPPVLEPLARYDVGHPLVVPAPVVAAFLKDFEPVHQNGNYFIGRKPTTLGTAKTKAWQKK